MIRPSIIDTIYVQKLYWKLVSIYSDVNEVEKTKEYGELLYRRLAECEEQFKEATKSKFSSIPPIVLYSDETCNYTVCDLCIIYGHKPPPSDCAITSFILEM